MPPPTPILVIDRPTRANVTGTVARNTVIDAVNAIPNEAARRLAIAALKERDPEGAWLTRRGGFLGVTE